MDSVKELILLVRSGNEKAFDDMCGIYNNLINSISRKYSAMCSTEYSVLDDFIQESKMAFYNAIISYDVENAKITFGAFAKVCIRNKLVSCVRKLNSKKRKKNEEAQVSSDKWSLQDAVVRRELGEKLILVAENSLSAYEKTVFSLYFNGKSAKEISLKLGKSEKSVNNAIYRIRLKLKKTVN